METSDVFVNREAELAVLEKAWRSSRAEFAVIWGRRRVGKTAMLRTFCQRRAPGEAVFWTADLTSEPQLRESFSQTIFQALSPGHAVPDAPFRSWEAAFRFASTLAAKEPLCLVVDEYPYLVQVERGISSILQRLWDAEIAGSKLKLILCGSHLGMMEREILQGNAPLFGRRTAGLHVAPLAAATLRTFFRSYKAQQRIEIYSVFGGIPKYLLACDPGVEPIANALSLLVNPAGPFFDEPLYLFREELSDPRNYLAIVRAIAGGNTLHNEIVQATGIDRGLTSRHLDTLQRLGFVKRMVPVTESNPERTRKSRYFLADPLVRFWYRFVAPRRPRIEGGQQHQVEAEIRAGFADFVAPTFEALCRCFVLENLSRWPGLEDARVGGWWSSQCEVDVLAVAAKTGAVLLGECKWSSRPIGESVLRDLQEKDSVLELPDAGNRYRVLFSRSGFTPALRKIAKREGVQLIATEDLASAGVV